MWEDSSSKGARIWVSLHPFILVPEVTKQLFQFNFPAFSKYNNCSEIFPRLPVTSYALWFCSLCRYFFLNIWKYINDKIKGGARGVQKMGGAD